MLERSQCVGKSKGHNSILEVFITGTESDFPFLSSGDANKGVHATEIDLGISFCLGQRSPGFLYQWQGVSVIDRIGIESALVDAEV